VGGLSLERRGTFRPVNSSRKLAAVAVAGALCLPLAACGESDVDKAKNEVQDAADSVKGNLDNVSKKDLEKALNDAQDAAKKGSADTKKKARELQDKIERELNSRK
jgi:uncharacterized protein YgiB involved in biofilm formation